MFTVLIADDHPLFRAALCHVIGSMFAEHRIYEASTLDDVRRLIGGAVSAGPTPSRTRPPTSIWT